MKYKNDSFETKLKAMFIDVAVPDSLSPENIGYILDKPRKNEISVVRSKAMQIAALLILVIGVTTVAMQLFAETGSGSQLLAGANSASDTAVAYSSENAPEAAEDRIGAEAKNTENIEGGDIGEGATNASTVAVSTKEGCLPSCTEEKCVPECPNYIEA